MEGIKLGSHYLERWLSNPVRKPNRVIVKVVKKPYGWMVHAFSSYVTLWYAKLIINDDGSAKVHVREERNYAPVQRYTIYYDRDGLEIISDGGSRKELMYYSSIRNLK